MKAVPWRDGATELRRLLIDADQDPGLIQDPERAWAVFRDFLAIPLDGLFDRWDGDEDADTLVVVYGGGPVRLVRRFTVAAVEWTGGEPGEDVEPDEEQEDLDLADTVQIELEMIFESDPGEADEGFWTAEHSAGFLPEDLDEAAALVAGLGLGTPIRSAVTLTTA
ncbi:hypothetical protein [Actinoplanes sp. NPDC051494]|uniref:hypothetical protein n=1 Tax=Actinoplanes sp. NPDC051494 TaxID=3363907 RepID=UPI0037925CE2